MPKTIELAKERFHPIAGVFPMMSGDEIEELAQDILANGQKSPILVDPETSQIVDGRNRFLACRKAGVEPAMEHWRGTDLLADVISWNLKRRQLNESQRAMVAARIATLPKGTNQHASIEAPSQTDAASTLNVGRASVQRAREVLANAAPEVVAQVDAGALPVSVAVAVSRHAPEFQRSVAEKVAAGEKPTEAVRQTRAETLRSKPVAAPTGKHRVILADPPWQYGDSRVSLGGYEATAAADHYPTMLTEEICALPVRGLADDDAVLFCWATFPLLPDALRVVEAWGFTYKTAIVWSKVRPNFGHYHRADAELLLIATRGSCTPDGEARPSQVQVVERTGRHSGKPDEFRALIDSMYPSGSRIELFRRGKAPSGWEVWGNEAA